MTLDEDIQYLRTLINMRLGDFKERMKAHSVIDNLEKTLLTIKDALR